jgi:release factor glutamine methyltransferase
MKWKDSITDAEKKLVKAGVEDARTNAEYLAAHVLSLKSRSELRPKFDENISNAQSKAFDQLILRRANREPLQYILSEWEFFGLPFKVGPEALIPRPETEILVEQALSEAAKMSANISILDIGTGTGCIALALAKHLPFASVVGIDVSSGAVELAKENARLLSISNVSLQIADIFSDEWQDSITTKFDLIVSNPPYVSRTDFEALEPELRNYEPSFALTDESNGLSFYERIAQVSPMLLNANGRLLMEIGYDASSKVEAILGSADFEILRIVDDLARIPRVVVAEFHAPKALKTA